MEYLTSSLSYSILPSLLTSSLQNILYTSNLIPVQNPQSPAFHRDKKIIYTLLVLGFLIYSTYTGYTGLGPSYYDVLGVSTSAPSSDLRTRSKLFHPDKRTNAEGPFLAVRHAYQVLLNPLSRRVYDLFGPTVAQWELKTEREFLVKGIGWTVLPGYIITFIALQVYSLFGRGGQVKYWRYLLFLCMITFEIHVLLHPSPRILNYFPQILKSLARFQLLSFLHKVTLSLTLALEHLAPLYTPPFAAEPLIARVEMSAVHVFGKSTQALVEEVGQVVEQSEGVERREVIERLKADIVEELINERYRQAKSE